MTLEPGDILELTNFKYVIVEDILVKSLDIQETEYMGYWYDTDADKFFKFFTSGRITPIMSHRSMNGLSLEESKTIVRVINKLS